MIKSKLTSMARTTIPLPIRTALRLATGDELAYRIEGDCVIVTKAAQGLVHDPFARFDEWGS
jgi:antitoxin PrlF